jgi:hypothetical protein
MGQSSLESDQSNITSTSNNSNTTANSNEEIPEIITITANTKHTNNKKPITRSATSTRQDPIERRKSTTSLDYSSSSSTTGSQHLRPSSTIYPLTNTHNQKTSKPRLTKAWETIFQRNSSIPLPKPSKTKQRWQQQ